jgi:hypothetical protein
VQRSRRTESDGESGDAIAKMPELPCGDDTEIVEFIQRFVRTTT